MLSVEKVFCIMTYYEYFELFYTVFNLLASIIRFHKLPKCGEDLAASISINLLNEIKRATKLYSVFHEDEKMLLSNLYKTNANSKCVVIPSINGIFKEDTFTLPKSEDINTTSLCFFCPLLFSTLSLNTFYEVFCHILLEHSIVFVSSNLALLTSSMYIIIIIVD